MGIDHIEIRGCKQHNLRDLDIDLPRGQFIVVTGVSGSGKSSLVFDTLFSEGQRRYLESLAIRGFLLPRPNVDVVEGLPPTLAIGQGLSALGTNQTVGTATEVHDLLAVLFARIGQQHSPTTGEQLERYTPSEVVEHLLRHHPHGTRLQILAPLGIPIANLQGLLERMQKMGFTRIRLNGMEYTLEEASSEEPVTAAELIVDRLVIQDEVRGRLSDSIGLAMKLGQGRVSVQVGREGRIDHYSEYYYCPSTRENLPPLRPLDFSFRSSQGWCESCRGSGCAVCNGSGLKAQVRACKIQGLSFPDLLSLPSIELAQQLHAWNLFGNAAIIASEILPRVHRRLEVLTELGLDYIALNRRGDTLSVGETQRVQLASQIGSRLAGIAYIMDEPSRGLHPLDIAKLRTLLRQLQGLGNTLIVVEHEAEIILAADHALELGPGAGRKGGELIYQGPVAALSGAPTPTGQWLAGLLPAPTSHNRKATGYLQAQGISCHNLRNLSVTIPLGVLVGFCGVSGSGKSSLVVDVLAKELQSPEGVQITGNLQQVARVQLIDQRAVGLSSRSIPATYVGLMTPLRELLAQTPLARARGYTVAQFSLNRRGGRCEVCEGMGVSRVRLAPLPDVWVACEACDGKRYNFETRQVTWQGHSIADILDMTVAEALQVFEPLPQMTSRLSLLAELGLDYLQLGQPFVTLSGGEAQRIKLVAELARLALEPTLYILDEPSGGLHAVDIAKLMAILHRLVDKGHSVWIIEHRLAILQQADWLIELGPGPGPQGGKIVFEGTPRELKSARTPTAAALRSSSR